LDNTADGIIGSAKFENARIKKNPGNPEKRGLILKLNVDRLEKYSKMIL
jgi:hypothetical protein